MSSFYFLYRFSENHRPESVRGIELEEESVFAGLEREEVGSRFRIHDPACVRLELILDRALEFYQVCRGDCSRGSGLYGVLQGRKAGYFSGCTFEQLALDETRDLIGHAIGNVSDDIEVEIVDQYTRACRG